MFAKNYSQVIACVLNNDIQCKWKDIDECVDSNEVYKTSN